MTGPIALKSLTPREAIADTVFRVLLGLDTNDIAMFKSALAEGALVELDGLVLKGDEILRLFHVVGPLDCTHHLSNLRIDVEDGADKASLTARGMGQHYRTGEGTSGDSKGLLTGTMFYMDLVKEGAGGLWVVKKWKADVLWRDGDQSIVDEATK